MKRPSELLKNIMQTPERDNITIGNFVELLGNRSFALIILILAMPNVLPIGIPGFSTMTGVPILCMALQMVWGRQVIWLPNKMAGKHLQQKHLNKIICKILPTLLWLEKFLRPRGTILCKSIGTRVIGLVIAMMASVLVLPIIGGNLLPGFSISLLALALLEKDGFLVVASILFTMTSFYLLYSVMLGVLKLVLDFI